MTRTVSIHLTLILVIGLALSGNKSNAQSKDGFRILIIKDTDKIAKFLGYSVHVMNASENPLCILHSSFVNLLYDTPQELALFDIYKAVENYTLFYTPRDTSYVYESLDRNYDGEILLPKQQLKFRLLIPKSNKKKQIQIKYIFLPDFCYKSFRQELYDSRSWHTRYDQNMRTIDLPR